MKKSNEITAIPALLDRIEPAGATVMIDAMGCRREIAQKFWIKASTTSSRSKAIKARLEDVELFAAEQKANGFTDTKVSRLKPSMAITAASKRESTRQSMTWPGCRSATLGPD